MPRRSGQPRQRRLQPRAAAARAERGATGSAARAVVGGVASTKLDRQTPSPQRTAASPPRTAAAVPPAAAQPPASGAAAPLGARRTRGRRLALAGAAQRRSASASAPAGRARRAEERGRRRRPPTRRARGRRRGQHLALAPTCRRVAARRQRAQATLGAQRVQRHGSRAEHPRGGGRRKLVRHARRRSLRAHEEAAWRPPRAPAEADGLSILSSLRRPPPPPLVASAPPTRGPCGQRRAARETDAGSAASFSAMPSNSAREARGACAAPQ